jgi:HAE1 family hydrophobic/amphiphilic exporter-1
LNKAQIQETPKKDFFKFTTTRPVAILMVVIGVSVFGWISYNQLPLSLMPDITYPSLTVRTEYEGTAPEEVETTVSRPVEQALGIVNNLVNISSVSKAGQSDVKLEFSWDTDMNQATSDVREKMDHVFLPLEVERPIILRYDPSLDPIMRLGLFGDVSLFYMRYLAEEDLKRILETVDGVAAVKVKGGLEEEIRVELDEQKLTLIGIDIQQVKNRLAQENINLAGGNLKEGQTEYLVRTLNEFKSVKEISDVVVGNWNGREIKISEIAHVIRTNKEREIITRINGKESVEIEVYKEADANIVEVAKRVKDRVFGSTEQQAFVRRLESAKGEKPKSDSEDQKKDSKKEQGRRGRGEDLHARQMTNFIAHNLPKGIQIDKLSDQSIFIENSVNEVKSTAIIGGILAIIVLFIFLRNFTATLIVGISIPISIVATFAPMKLFHVSLNIMSLGGLALGIGMLVDNSIVVLESIARCREEGDDLIRATIRGVGEVGGAVFAATLTTVAVFFPIVFVEGVAGQIFGDLALTVVFSLLASLAVALFLIPMLSSRQTSTFIGDMGALDKHIFQFSTEDTMNSLMRNEPPQPVIKKARSGVLVVIKTMLLTLWKILKVVIAFTLSMIKQFYLLLFLIVMPLLGLAKMIGITSFRPGEWWKAHALNTDFRRKLTYIKEIWPTFLVFRSHPTLFSDFSTAVSRFKNRRWYMIPLLVIVFIIKSIIYVIKYLCSIGLELVFRIFHFLITAAGLFIKGIYLVAKLLFAGPAALVIYLFEAGYSKLEAFYPRVLKYALEKRAMVIGTMVALFAFSVLIVAPRLGSELIPEVHQGEFNLDATLPVGTPVERTDERIVDIQNFLVDHPDVDQVAAVIGTDKTTNTETEEGEHTAKITVTLNRKGNIITQEERLIETIREEMNNHPGIQSNISRPVLFSFKTPVEVEIHGYNISKLQRVTEEIERSMRSIEGLYDVKSNMQRGNPEVQIEYDRKLISHYGLNIMNVAAIVRNKIRGDVATEFKEQDRKIDILVRLREEDKESIDNLKRLVINPDGDIPIPLEAVATLKVKEGPSEIRRVDQQRTVVITANIGGRDLRSVSEDIFQLLRDSEMPDDFTFTLAGQNKEMETSLDSLKLALALAIFLVYIVMASQFESLIHPFVIIFTIPLALIGVILFLYMIGVSLSIVVFLGMIMLAGIVVNNAIVLVDYINQLRARGLEKYEAIIEGGKIRLRPILMTTSTTVLGLLPMALGMGDGAEIRTPMAITVIVGLITSTILTLIVIPTVYSIVDRKDVRS